jgi:hypothetical protein
MSERVDKAWASKGLDTFSSEAILATLQHYGVAVDEAGFKAQAADKSPLAIGMEWLKGWKGTGQFARFPAAAAEILWRRWLPERPTPGGLVEGVVRLLEALSRLRVGKARPEEVEEAFTQAETTLGRLPRKDGTVDAGFVQEGWAFLPEQVARLFDEMAEELAKAGHVEAGERFVKLEETLFPERAGVASAMVQAARGEKDAAVATLAALTGSEVEAHRRLMAVDGLLHLQAVDKARAPVEAMLEVAEKEQDWHLALDLAGRLDHILQAQGDTAARAALHERARRLDEGHTRAHPGHRRAHRH